MALAATASRQSHALSQSNQPQCVQDTWAKGSKLEIFSKSMNEWFRGRVNDIYHDDEGEWLRITYLCKGTIRMKDVSRYGQLIRPIRQRATDDHKEEAKETPQVVNRPVSSTSAPLAYTSLEEIFRLNDDEARTLYALRLLNEFRRRASEEDMMKYRASRDRIAKMEAQARDVEKAQRILNDNDGWVCQVENKKDISVFYRTEENSSIHSLKIVMRTVADPIHIFTIVREVDLMPQLFGELMMNSLVKLPKPRVKILEEVSARHLFVYGAGQITALMKARDGIVEVFGVDAMDEHGEWIVVGKSCEEFNGVASETFCRELERQERLQASRTGETPPSIKKDRVHKIEIKFACSSLRYVNKSKLREANNEIEIKTYLNIDVKSPIPQSVINFLSRNFAHMCTSLFRKKCEQFDYSSPYGDRLATRAYYPIWRRRLQNVQARRRRGFL